MKKYTSFAGLIMIVLLMAVSSSNSYAQNPVGNTENKIVEREANFTLKFVGEEVANVTITLKATYETKNNKYTLQFIKNNEQDKNKTTKVFTYPLNYEYLINEFNSFYYNEYVGSKDNKTELEKDHNRFIISITSIEPIFFWMYAMKGELEEKVPVAGKMHVRRFAMIFGNNNDEMGEAEREKILDSFEIKMYKVNSEVRSAYNEIKHKSINYIQDIEKKFEEDTAKIDKENTLAANRDKLVFAKYNKVKQIKKNVAELLNRLEIDPDTTKEKIDLLSKEIEDSDFSIDIATKSKEYHNKRKEQNTLSKEFIGNNVFIIKSISIKIERGFIEDVHVEIGNDHNGTDWYDNIVPIGFSSLSNIKALGSMRLHIRKPKWSNQKNYVYLSDILENYDINEELQTRDYAPADTVINNLDPTIDRFIIFKREQRIQLFDSRIYSDLAGLDEKSPNGLLQIEVSRRFNFITNRRQYPSFRADWGYLNYIYLYGTLSKIDQKLRRLPLNNAYYVENNTITSPNYVTNLDLRRYENASIGLDINLLIHNHKDGKFIAYADYGIRYGHIPIEDKVKRLNAAGILEDPGLTDFINKEGHTITHGPKIRFEYLSERRIGFNASYQYNYSMLFSNNEFKQVASASKSDLYDRITERIARKSHQFSLEVRVLAGSSFSDNIFLRTRFFIQQGDASTFFPQIQIGYNYNLIFKK